MAPVAQNELAVVGRATVLLAELAIGCGFREQTSCSPDDYPGQRSLQTRRDNTAQGIPIDPECWQRVLEL